MMQNITIPVPEGKIARYNEETNTIEFISKSRTWNDFCKNHPNSEHEFYPNPNGEIVEATNKNLRTSFNWKILFSSRKEAEAHTALAQLTRLHDEWIGDWKPDYYSASLKYTISPIRDSFGVEGTYARPSLLTFPTDEMAKDFLNSFKELIETAKMYL